MSALPTTSGVKQEFLVNATNDGESTYAPDGLAAAPIFGLGGQQLQGDEIVAGGIATLVSFVEPLLNDGQLCWILVSCTSGALQVAPASQSLQAVQLQQVQGIGQIRGLVGGNNVSSPNTKMDFNAMRVVLRNPVTGLLDSVAQASPITCDIGAAGPVANGRDQADAFTPGQWLRYFYIFDGETLATIVSTATPDVGPQLPPGFKSWQYIGSMFLSATSTLPLGTFRGAWFEYTQPPEPVTAGTATTLTKVPVQNFVPPEAAQFEVTSSNLSTVSDATTGLFSLTCVVANSGSNGTYNFGLQGGGKPGVTFGVAGPAKQLQNIDQSFGYFLITRTGTTPLVTFTVNQYNCPNGG
jgi:hypothetical protein